jgi:acetyl-CoA C-acetyltransferase
MNNPFAHLQKKISIEDVLNSPMLSYPIKLLDVCPRSDGACAVIFAAENRAKKITPCPAWIQAVATRHNFSWFGDLEYDRIPSLELASKEVYQKAGIREPLKELDLIELYQPYSFAGLKWIEALGLCGSGEAPSLLWDGVTDMGGELPINPSGGVLSTNCIGATGLIRVAEAALQVMGKAGDRQVPDVKKALATGFGGCYWSDVLLLGKDAPSNF